MGKVGFCVHLEFHTKRSVTVQRNVLITDTMIRLRFGHYDPSHYID